MEKGESSRLSQRLMQDLFPLIPIHISFKSSSTNLLSTSPPSPNTAKSSIKLKVSSNVPFSVLCILYLFALIIIEKKNCKKLCWIWWYRNLNNFSERFSKDCEKAIDFCFLLFTHLCARFSDCYDYELIIISSEVKIYYTNKSFINFLCETIVYKVEKSKHDMNVALPRLVTLFI